MDARGLNGHCFLICCFKALWYIITNFFKGTLAEGAANKIREKIPKMKVLCNLLEIQNTYVSDNQKREKNLLIQ